MKGRDPDWTCIVNGKNGAGDVYIHRLDSILGVDTTAFASRLRIGDAQVSEKHCNFLLNLGGASSADIEELGESGRSEGSDHGWLAPGRGLGSPTVPPG